MAGVLDLTGDKKLMRQLEALGKVAKGKAIRPASRAAMKLMQQEAKRLAPRDTGTLRKNILLKAGKKPRNSGIFQHWVAWAKRDKFGIDDDAAGFYPAVQEYGSKYIEGTSHIRPAWERKRVQIETTMVRSLRRIVLKAARTQ